MPTFGFQTATEGGGYTWSANSRENQLTPWSNDPVSDPAGRGLLSQGRRNRRCLEPDGAADPRPPGDLRRAARSRLQPLRAHRARHRRRPPAVRAAGGIDQDIAPATDQRNRIARASSASPPMSNGCSARRDPLRSRFVETEIGCASPARSSRAIPGIRRSARASPSPTCAARRRTGPAIAANSSAAMARWRTRRRSRARRRCPTRSARASTPAPRCARRSNCRPAASPKIVFFLGDAATREGRPRDDQTLSRRRSRRRRGRSRALLGRDAWARSRSRRPTARWTSCSTAGCSIRRSPAASGRARPSIRPAAPMAFAISCRTAWRSSRRGPI